jgi:hypothetical protein
MAYLGTKPANSPLTSELIPDGLIGTSDLANEAVSAAKLTASLDLSGKTLALPAANSSMTRIYSGDVTSSVSSIDLDLSGQTFQSYKLYIRNWLLASDAFPTIRKLTAAGTAVGTCYGGATRAGEGVVAHVQYSGVDSFYLLGDNSTVTNSSSGQYLMAWDITISRQANNMTQMFGNGVARVTGGRTQNINTGCLDINTGTFWGIRIGSNANTTNIKYALYGVNTP